MSTERLDYRNERQRHEKFVGREALLARCATAVEH